MIVFTTNDQTASGSPEYTAACDKCDWTERTGLPSGKPLDAEARIQEMAARHVCRIDYYSARQVRHAKLFALIKAGNVCVATDAEGSVAVYSDVTGELVAFYQSGIDWVEVVQAALGIGEMPDEFEQVVCSDGVAASMEALRKANEQVRGARDGE